MCAKSRKMMSRLAFIHLPFVLAVFGTIAGVVDGVGVDISGMNCTTLALGNSGFRSGDAATSDYSSDDGKYLIFYAKFNTPATFNAAYEDLFLAGGTTKCGGFYSGIYDSGKLFFGIQCSEDPAPVAMKTPLTANTEYKMEVMYDRTNKQARGRDLLSSSPVFVRTFL